jgi:hypothetical protein
MAKVLGRVLPNVTPTGIIDSMFSEIGSADAAVALARLHDAVTAVITLPPATLAGDDVLAVLRGLEGERNRLNVADHALIAETEAQGAAHQHACPSTANLLTQLLRISPTEAALRVRAAADLGPRRALSGEVLPPIFAQVAAAQAAGAISPAHARVITRTIDALPAAVAAEHDTRVETSLVGHAHTLNPRQLALCARRISDYLDPDGTLRTEHDRHRRRELAIHPRPDGSARLDGELTPLCAEGCAPSWTPWPDPPPPPTGNATRAAPGNATTTGCTTP